MISILPIDFIGQGALLEPADKKLHDMAVDFCMREIPNAPELNLSKLTKAWVAVEMDGQEYGQILGITGVVFKIDAPVFRSVDAEAGRLLGERINSWCGDNGWRGHEIFVHVARNEKPEQRCAAWKDILVSWNAKSAERVAIKVR